MDYSDLKTRKIGENVYIMYDNSMYKATIIGFKIRPFPNPQITGLMYLIVLPGRDKETWVEDIFTFSCLEDLQNEIKELSDETISYKELGKFNFDTVRLKYMSPSEIEKEILNNPKNAHVDLTKLRKEHNITAL